VTPVLKCPSFLIAGLTPNNLLTLRDLDLTSGDKLAVYTMPPKPRFLFMDRDDLSWQKLDDATDEWHMSTGTGETYRAVGNLILNYKDGQAVHLQWGMLRFRL
jgi:hypothetical protein